MMNIDQYQLVSLITLCLLLLCLQLPRITAAEDRVQAKLHGSDDGTLLFEAAADQNITFRLMGEAATLLLNEVDIVAQLQRRRLAAAARTAAARREPMSLEALKEQFRSVQRDLARLARWLGHTQNGTRRTGPTQRVLRRDLQRIQVITQTLMTLEANLQKDECRSSPCKNGGTCYDAYKAFHCDCAAGWQGNTCEDDVNECFDFAGTALAGCKNEGQCINTPGSYRCVCRNGFSGAHCRLRQNACLSNQSAELCGSHGTCLAANNAAGFVCICDQGWTWADVNVTAASASPCTRDVDECAPAINPCYDECINLLGSFRCGACPPGYTGDGKYCHDVNECANDNNGGCSQRPKVTCINTEGSVRCGRCPPGWTGDGRVCEEAKSNSCNAEQICSPRAECEYISGTVVCSCPDGFFGHGYGAHGCTEDSGRKPCDDHRCLNNGTCVLSGRGTSCICQPGYTGALCAEADACHPNPCQNEGTCRLLPGNQHQCTCPPGYTGNSCSNVRSYCGLVLRNETGSIQFPPSAKATSDYQPNERCAFIIRAARGRVLNVTFGMFDLQTSADCSADYVQLHDGSTLTARLIGRFCGNALPLVNGSVLSTQEQLLVWFRSDNETQGRGFNLTWHSQPLVCGEELQLKLGANGILRSPSYPGKTRPGLDCRWRLEAPFGNRVLLRFYEITLGDLPLDGNCSNWDSLIVRDSHQDLYVTCRSAQPAPLHSSSNIVSIHFHTDLYRTDSAFQLHYEVEAGHPGCGGVFTEPRGVIRGFMNTEICLYLIEQPAGMQIELTFHDLNVLEEKDCYTHELAIFDGRTDEQPLMRRYCGQPDKNELQPVTSRGNHVLIRYKFGLYGIWKLNKSFELSYNRVCSGTYSDADGGFIVTPNYPNSYIEQQECIFNIHGPLNKAVHMTIVDLSLSATRSPGPDTDDLALNVDDQLSYLDVYLSRNVSAKQRFFNNLTNKILISDHNQARLVFHGAGNPQHARGMRVDYKFIGNDCGGVLSTPSGSHSAIVNNQHCRWIIESPGRKHFKITMRQIHGDCQLQIFDNSTGTEGILLKTLGINEESILLNFDEDIDASLLTITISTTKLFELCYVKMTYDPVTKGCGGKFTSEYGIIKSPNWPSKYRRLEDCTWIIKAPLGSRIELIAHNFTLEDVFVTYLCFGDFLEIRNGETSTSPLIGYYCGTKKIPPRVPSIGNALYLHFYSDHLNEGTGFYLNWQITASGCGGKLSSRSGTIESPHRLEANHGEVDCDYQITVVQGSTVGLKLTDSKTVCKGQLTIYDGPTTSSAKLPLNCSLDNLEDEVNLVSSSNRVLVLYSVPRESPRGIDFKLEYWAKCQVTLDQMRGAIESPNFPNYVTDIMGCSWDIRAGGGNNRIQLAFSHIGVGRTDTSTCPYYYVVLSDYKNEQLLSERQLCNHKDLDITSVGNRLLIRFKKFFLEDGQGFRAEYQRVGCGTELLGTGSDFETPNAPYSVDMDCEWLITVPEGHQIRLTLLELHIETPQRDCSQDVLEILPNDNSSRALLRSCQVESNQQTLISPTNELRVRFHSSPQRARKYFKASYAMVPASCGGYLTVSSGTISSPGYHDQDQVVYDKDVECVWNLEAADSYNYLITFNTFNLTSSADCTSFLEMSGTKADKSEKFVRRSCSDILPDILLVRNTLRVHFKVTAGSWGRFELNYQLACGGPRSDSEGYLRSRLDEVCYWTITGLEGSKISLNIRQLDCPHCTATPQRNCTAGLSIWNAEDGVRYFNLCQEHPANLIVPTNNVRIGSNGIAFSAHYTSIENSCGGKITSVRGTLGSPNYPDSYPANAECLWELEPRAGNAIELTFEAIDIAKTEYCNGDFLEVRDGLQGNTLGVYCGNELPAAPLITMSKVLIKFRSQPGSSANGFKLRWSYAHDNEITNTTNGIIESPPVPAVRGDDQHYSWRIFVERKHVVVLDFKEYNTGLTLFDGFDDTALAIAIGSSPWQFTSSSNVVYMETVNTEYDAFRLQWHVLRSVDIKTNVTLKSDKCNEEYTLDEGMVELKSPGYPYGYKPNINCMWTFKVADPAEHAYADLVDVKLEVMDRCQADYVSVQGSSNFVDWQEQMRVCNSSEILRVNGTPNLRVQFVADATINGTGFTANVHTACGSNMTDSVGTILDPYLKGWFKPISTVCEWHIEVQPGKVIDFSIDYIDAAQNDTCSYFGIIYDGLDAGAPALAPGKFCNQLGYARRTFRTTGPHAYIKYFLQPYQVRSHENNRWNLTYREFNECDAEVRLTMFSSSYNISTPGYPYYPHGFSDCTWKVLAPPGETIAATFVDAFDLSIHFCSEEFVELYDGLTKVARRLLKTCQRPATIHSTGNALLVHYQTQLETPHRGFRLNVSLSTCGGHFTSFKDSISSEHYPALGAYSKPAVCEYIINTPKNTHIELTFSDLHLPFDDIKPDSGDRIEVLDLTNERRIIRTLYANVTTPFAVTLSVNAVALRFVTVKAVNSYRGFKLTYLAVRDSCFISKTAVSGLLEITRPQTPYTWMRECQWRITVPKGQRVRLELLNLADFRTAEVRILPNRLMYRMYSKALRFYNDAERSSLITEFNLNTYNGSGIIESTDNFMLARITLMQNISMITLRARFSSEQASICPPDIGRQAAGTLTNQEFFNMFSYYCAIHFVAEPGETFVLSFQKLLNRQVEIPVRMHIKDDVLHADHLMDFRYERFSLATTAGQIILVKMAGEVGARFQATYRRYPCGGLLRLAEGSTFELPTVRDHVGPLECVWMLKENAGYELSGNFTFSDSCEREYLIIYKQNNIKQATICGDGTQINTTLLEGPKLVYHAEQYRPGSSQLQLQVNRPKALGGFGNIVRLRDQPTMPVKIDAHSYKNNMELSWEFQTSDNLAMRLKFQDIFFVELATNCSHDYLEVLSYQNDVWRSIAKYCGRDLPKPMHIQAQRMRIVFRTNANITCDGFTFVVVPTCDVKLEASRELRTLSVNRRPWRRSTLSCNYEFITDTKHQLVVSVKNKGRNWSERNCRSDYIESYRQVGQQEQLIGKRCPDFEISGFGRLRLNYNSITQDRIFEMSYQLVGCGGNHTEPFTLRPPLGDTEDRYATGQNCEWHVLAPPQHAIFVRFKYFEIEDSSSCQFDRVSIYRGNAVSKEQRISNLCGNLTTPTVMVDSNQATILAKLHGYMDGRGRGFLATVHFTPNCNERLTLSAGNSRMSLVRHYALNSTKVEDLHCYFRANAAPGYRLSVWLKQLQLNANRCVAGCNTLEVIDGFADDDASLGSYSAVVGNGTRLFSTQTDLLIKLSGSVAQPNGISFELILQMEATLCGQTDYVVNSNETFYIRLNADNLTSGYEGSIHCVWRFKSDEALEININSVQLQDVSQLTGKCNDYLQLSVDDEIYKSYCGQFKNIPVDSLGMMFEITFHSSGTGSPYELDVSIKQKSICNRTYTDLNANIFYFTNKDDELANCTNYIRLPEGYSLTFDIKYVNFEYTFNKPIFNITDLRTNRSIYNITESYGAFATIYSTSNAIRVMGLGVRMLQVFYYATSNSLPVGCGGDLTLLEGFISNPPYDNRNYSDCNWRITVPAGNTLSFNFNIFNMGSETNCQLDNVKLYEVMPDNSEKLRQTFCGEDMPDPFSVHYNRLRIVAKKSPNFNGIGFRLAYTTYYDTLALRISRLN